MPYNTPKKLRSSAHAKQDGRCYYCDQPMWIKTPDEILSERNITVQQAKRFKCTAEHLHARKDGGADKKTNIVAACRFCNHRRHQRKKDLSPDQYKKLVQSRMSKRRWHAIPL